MAKLFELEAEHTQFIELLEKNNYELWQLINEYAEERSLCQRQADIDALNQRIDEFLLAKEKNDLNQTTNVNNGNSFRATESKS